MPSSKKATQSNSHGLLRFIESLKPEDIESVLAARSPSGHNFLSYAIANMNSLSSNFKKTDLAHCLSIFIDKIESENISILEENNISIPGLIHKVVFESKKTPPVERKHMNQLFFNLLKKYHDKSLDLTLESMGGFSISPSMLITDQSHLIPETIDALIRDAEEIYSEIRNNEFKRSWGTNQQQRIQNKPGRF